MQKELLSAYMDGEEVSAEYICGRIEENSG